MIVSELWDAYDKDMNLIDGITLVRGVPIREGEYHIVCDIVVKHIDGTYLLMQRDPVKKYGGLWELSVGGSALKGETPLECAIRELREETGIIAHDIKEIGRFTRKESRAHYVEFFCTVDCKKDSIVLQEDETVDYRWIDKEELREISGSLSSKRILSYLQI